MDTTTGRRRYDSALRQANAQATRLRIVEAARALMLGRGYAGTSMADVARAAGVAVQTLYASCPGGKPALAKLVYDVTLAGDAQPVPQSGRPEVQAIVDEPDPAAKLARYAAMAAGILDRVGPVHRVLRAAAASTPGDSALPDLLADTERQRRAGARGLTEHLAAGGHLGDGWTAERAADHVYVLTSPEVAERLADTCGWGLPGYRGWLAGVLTATLLGPAPTFPTADAD